MAPQTSWFAWRKRQGTWPALQVRFARIIRVVRFLRQLRGLAEAVFCAFSARGPRSCESQCHSKGSHRSLWPLICPSHC